MPMIFPVFRLSARKQPSLQKMSITEIPLSILGSLKPMDLEEYLYNLKVYEKDGMAHTNEERGIKRKLSSLRSFYKYLYKMNLYNRILHPR